MSDNYTVLARKYRSPDFGSLIGQDVLVKTLTTAINTNRIAHAYIFTGIRGTGKTSTARILAKALNCTAFDRATATPCGQCDNCRAIANGQHIDVMELDAASHTGVENMRDLLDAAQYKPTNGRYKVYIIDEVHMLSTSAFNALLKTLEEPPEHIVFILATTEIRKVPVTILSRCQRFDLARVPVETLKVHFARIAGEEKVELTDAANSLISASADGSVRDGLSLLDQAIAMTGGKVDEAAVLDMLKRADRMAVHNFMKTILTGDAATAISAADDLYSGGADLTLFLYDMMEWTHWMTRLHPAIRLPVTASIPYSANQRDDMVEIARNVTLGALSKLWQTMVASVEEMQKTANQKQSFDMLIVRLIDAATDKPAEVARTPPVAHAGDTPPVGGNTPAPKPTINTVADLVAALTKSREAILAADVSGNLEVVEFTDGKIKFFHRNNDKTFAGKIGKFLAELTGKQWAIEQLSESPNAQTAVEQKATADANDPLAQDMMSLFAGAEVTVVTND